MKLIRKAGIAALTLFFANTIQGQPTATAQPLADLMKLEGKWAGEATLTMAGKTYSFHYTANFAKTADGSGIHMVEGFSHPELGTLVGENLIGYNANDGKIHWFSVDNFGTSHDHLGAWKSADHFYMEAHENQQGKKFVERIDVKTPDAATIELHLVGLLDGNPSEEVTCTFHRVNG